MLSATVLTLPDGTRVRARLAPEVIQKVVRANFAVFRTCYEAGLARSPKLEGRVSVRFVIGLDGKVSEAEEARDEAPAEPPAGPRAKHMPDAEVVRCVLRGFRALAFPAPVGGVVTTTYPLSFAPGG